MADEQNIASATELVHLVVMDAEACRYGTVVEDVATTLVAVASEDPVDWDEMHAYWPRYRSRGVPEFLSSVSLEIVAKQSLHQAIGDSKHWIVLDLIEKRFSSGETIHPIGRDACFAMHTDEDGKQHDPLSIHLAPWWELKEQVVFATINRPRRTPLEIPKIDREFLFGSPLVHAIADHVLKIASEGRLTEAIKNSDSKTHDPFYSLTIEVHRDWLMTPHEGIGGRHPRQLLHGGVDWIEKLVWGQRMRFEDRGSSPHIVAAPKDCLGYRYSPMGREEMAIYFDLCRELIGASWHWCETNFSGLDIEESPDMAEPIVRADDEAGADRKRSNTLVGFLNEVKSNWLQIPFEGGSAPAFILECSRRRVPRGGGVEIIGMDERQEKQHVIDCDCPICVMMAEGKMGVGFCSIDGHHLELDDEFAFSMHTTREAWETEQREYTELSAKWDREREQRERQADESKTEEDEFASVWSSSVSDEPIPGDTGGNVKLAFLLAEIVTEMKQADTLHDSTSVNSTTSKTNASALVEQLNADFTKFRHNIGDELAENAKSLTNTLEQIAIPHPRLRPRIADFQSRVAESIRRPVHKPESLTEPPWDEDGFPF